MIRIICDRCLIDITGSEKIGSISMTYYNAKDGDMPNLGKRHYCASCMKQISDFIEKCEPQAKAETVQESTSETKAKRSPRLKGNHKIDYGKIMALRNAGWSNAKIADEMKMTAAAVSNAIWRAKNNPAIVHTAELEGE